MHLIDIDYYDSATLPYGVLLPGNKMKVPVVLASTTAPCRDCKRGHVFFDTMSTEGHRSSSNHTSPHVDVTVPSRTTDGGGDKEGWGRTNNMFSASGGVFLSNTRFVVTNAWMGKSGRVDEPANTHTRDHVWNVYLHGVLQQHLNADCNASLLPESSPEFRYELDYLWRIPRHNGDLRKVPMLTAEVTDMHMDAKEGDFDSDTIGLRVMTAEGPLQFGVRAPESSLPDMDVCKMNTTMRQFYGTDSMYTTMLNRLCMTAIVYSLMKNHNISRKAAFDFLDVSLCDVYPVMKPGFYTFDDPCTMPYAVYGKEKFKDKRFYRLFGESLFDGTASQADFERFKEMTGSTWDYLTDVQAMFALNEPLDSDIWWGGDKYKPDWRLSVRTCGLLADYLERQEDIPWDHRQLKGENDIWNVDWDLGWTAWNKTRNNRTDFCLLKRLGVIPFLPRIAPTAKQARKWDWLASYRRRLYPACVVVWNKIENQAGEIAKLAKMLGENISPKDIKEALALRAHSSGRPDTAVFLLGVLEFTAMHKKDVEKAIKDHLGSYIYMPRP